MSPGDFPDVVREGSRIRLHDSREGTVTKVLEGRQLIPGGATAARFEITFDDGTSDEIDQSLIAAVL